MRPQSAGGIRLATQAQVAITEASIRERQQDRAETGGVALRCVEIRPIHATSASGGTGAAAATGGKSGSGKPVSRATAEYSFQTAFEMRTQGRFEDALEVLSAGVKRHPVSTGGTNCGHKPPQPCPHRMWQHDYRLLFNRGYLHYKCAEWRRALQDFAAALAVLRSGVDGDLHALLPPLRESIAKLSSPA